MIQAENNYACVIENKLYFGNQVMAKNEDELTKLGITSIVDLINYLNGKLEIKHSDKFSVFHLSVVDLPTNNIDWCEEAAAFIEKEISNNKKVYVHCVQGISRSTTCVIYYLMTREKKTLKESFDYLRSIRKVVSPIYGFMKGLSELEMKLYNKVSFTPEEYSILCLHEVFPSVDIEDVKKMYDESKNEVENKKEEWEKKREEENIEPTGYLCFEKLLTKYGNEALVRRYGCSAHHPFD